MIDVLQEITPELQPHIYYVEGDKLVAFQPVDSERIVYSTPLKHFSKRFRKFKKLGKVEAV
jgi:hypothetical protein